jgi:D-3-phosphoglycerate dehydrogenase
MGGLCFVSSPVHNVYLQLTYCTPLSSSSAPGGNANSVKELVLCGLFLAARGVLEGHAHVHTIVEETRTKHDAQRSETTRPFKGVANETSEDDIFHDEVCREIESSKKLFAGSELAGKTLALVGLGAIGSLVAEAALSLKMNVVGEYSYFYIFSFTISLNTSH